MRISLIYRLICVVVVVVVVLASSCWEWLVVLRMDTYKEGEIEETQQILGERGSAIQRHLPSIKVAAAAAAAAAVLSAADVLTAALAVQSFQSPWNINQFNSIQFNVCCKYRFDGGRADSDQTERNLIDSINQLESVMIDWLVVRNADRSIYLLVDWSTSLSSSASKNQIGLIIGVDRWWNDRFALVGGRHFWLVAQPLKAWQ